MATTRNSNTILVGHLNAHPAFSGRPLGAYHPEWGNVLTRIPFGIALMGIGFASPFFIGWHVWKGGAPWWIFPLALLWSFAVGVFGFVVMSSWWKRIGRTITLHDDCMVLSGYPDGGRVISWTDVTRILVITCLEDLPLNSPLLAQLAPKTKRHIYEFFLHGDHTLLVEDEDLQHKSTFPKTLREVASRFPIVWEECEVNAGFYSSQR